MNLKDFLASRDNKENENYWSLVIEPGWIQACIWRIIEGKAEIIAVGPPAAWSEEEELIGVTDTALSSTVQSLPEDAPEPSKTVFGVPTSWVTNGQIKDEYLDKIKKVCAELSLSPVGFVTLPEAIAHFIKSEEGAPLNAIVLGTGDENLEIAVFKLGNLVGTTTVARSVSIADDVKEGLTRFATNEALPSRFLLYDGKEGELEEVKQLLIGVSWDDLEKIKFLHTPKIEIVTTNQKVLSVALAGASEMANVSSFLEHEEKQETEELKQSEESQLGEADNFIEPKDFGFVVGEDVAVKQQIPQGQTAVSYQTAEQSQLPQKPAIPFNILRKAKNLVTNMFSKIENIGGKRTLTIGLVLLATLFIIGFVSWWFLPKASITVFVSPKKLEDKLTIYIDMKATSPDFSAKVLPGEVIKTAVSGEKTKSTSGTKKVGEKAKGNVKIRNGKDKGEDINLPAGTILTSAGGLKYLTDLSASISAALSTTDPGTANVGVTASELGAEYNLAKDEIFKVGNYFKAEIDAISVSDFAGGSSRDISTVAVEDQKSLEDDLTQELNERAKLDLLKEISSDKFFIEESIVATPSSKTFSGKIGDEASNLKLSLSLDTVGVVVNKTSLFDLAKEVLKSKVPQGFVVRDDQIKVSFEFKGLNKNRYEFNVGVSINLLPEVKPDEIAKKIAGKYPTLAQDYLTTIPGFVRAEIKFIPKLPGRLGTLPRVFRNINVEISAEK